jgi:hypothetical protein
VECEPDPEEVVGADVGADRELWLLVEPPVLDADAPEPLDADADALGVLVVALDVLELPVVVACALPMVAIRATVPPTPAAASAAVTARVRATPLSACSALLRARRPIADSPRRSLCSPGERLCGTTGKGP